LHYYICRTEIIFYLAVGDEICSQYELILQAQAPELLPVGRFILVKFAGYQQPDGKFFQEGKGFPEYIQPFILPDKTKEQHDVAFFRESQLLPCLQLVDRSSEIIIKRMGNQQGRLCLLQRPEIL